MTEKMTEKELAKKLGYKWSTDESITWADMARHAAELLGATLAPEKPEPGTLYLDPEDGTAYLRIEQRNPSDPDGLAFRAGSPGPINSYQTPWHRYAPARVVAAEPVELSDGALVREWNEAMDAEADTDLRWERVTGWAFMGKGDQAVLRRFAHNLLAKHGHGQDATNLRSEVERLQNKLREAEQTLVELRPALPDPLNKEQVGELFETARGHHWLTWDSWTDTSQGIITRTVNAAIIKQGTGRVEVPAEPVEWSEDEVGEIWDEVTDGDPDTSIWADYSPISKRRWSALVNATPGKHGHGRATRELPSRARVERALIDGLKGTGEDLSYKARQRATEAVMDLQGGGDRG